MTPQFRFFAQFRRRLNGRKALSIILAMILMGMILLPVVYSAPASPRVFVIVTAGFWGSMDKLPSGSPSWLAQSPYPHYRKHQDAAYLTGPEYRPIPQKYLKTGQGPSLGVLVINSYYLMERELSYWARRYNDQAGREEIKIFDDWEVLRKKESGGESAAAAPFNLIYLKYDWRLGLDQTVRDYVDPLLETIDTRWPGSEIHWVGHSLGGLVGRYAVACHPGRFNSLVTIGTPHYGSYEIGAQMHGERMTYGGRLDIEWSQQIGLNIVERIIFGTGIVHIGKLFTGTARQFAETYLPMMHWLDPSQGLLNDGFGSHTKLSQAVSHAIALYGLGFGSYDLKGQYHPRIEPGWNWGVGPGLGEKGGPPEYAVTGDGRVDPISARGPFTNTLCLGMDKSHGNLMWSPLVLTFLVDRYFYGGAMPSREEAWAWRRLGVTRDELPVHQDWLRKAREVWNQTP